MASALATFVRRWPMVRRRQDRTFYPPYLTDLINVMLGGEIEQFVVPILYSTNECAIRKKNGGIRPIAVGSTIRRLSAKLGSRPPHCLAIAQRWLDFSSNRFYQAGSRLVEATIGSPRRLYLYIYIYIYIYILR